MKQVVGIDAGGTKTLGLMVGEDGTVLARARGPGANFQVHEESYVEDVLRRLLGELAATSGRAAGEISSAFDALCIGMAGVDRADDRRALLGVFERLGVSAPVRIENDAFVALVAGSSQRRGIVLVAGTGSVAYGVDDCGKVARAGGWGHLLADEGSGFWLGHKALRHSIRAAEGRGPETSLVGKVSAQLGLEVPKGLVAWAYGQDSPSNSLSELSFLVAEAAAEGDAVALGLVDEAARHLARTAEAVARQLRFGGSYPLVLSGGVLRENSIVARRLAEVLELPEARILPLTVEPARGSANLAFDLVEAGL